MVHVAIRFFTGQIFAHGSLVLLPGKESQLLFTIAAAEYTVSVEKILDQLWPEADGDAAHNSFHVCLYRVRRHLDAGPLVTHKSQNYAVSDQVDVDLRDLRTLLSAPATTAEDVQPFFRRIVDGRSARNGNGDWFRPFEDILIGYVQKCGHILCQDSLRTQDFTRATIYAREIMQFAPDDPESLDTLMRCQAATAAISR